MFLLLSYGGEKNQTNQKLAWFRALFNHLKLCCNDSTFISVAVVLAHTYTESLITSQQPSWFPIRDLMLLQERLEVCTPYQVSLWSKLTNVSLTASQVEDSRASCQMPVRCWNSEPEQSVCIRKKKPKNSSKTYHKPRFPAKGMRGLIHLF